MFVYRALGYFLSAILLGTIIEGNTTLDKYWYNQEVIYFIYFTQIVHAYKVSSIEVDLLETGVKRCPDGLEIESVTECQEACEYLKIPLSSNQFKEGKPCYKGGSNVCNQNGAFGRNAKLICKKTGNVM